MSSYTFGMQGGHLGRIPRWRIVRLGFGRLNVQATVQDGHIVAATLRHPDDGRRVVHKWIRVQLDKEICPWSDPDECSTARERSVAGTSRPVPACPVHGPFKETL